MSKLSRKKFAVLALSVLAIMVVGVSLAVAQGPVGAGASAGSTATTPGANFVDEDGDGLCDLAGSGQRFGPRGQGGNGSCGADFVDEDGDGLCDLAATGQVGNGFRGGQGNGFGHGMGRGGWGASATQ